MAVIIKKKKKIRESPYSNPQLRQKPPALPEVMLVPQTPGETQPTDYQYSLKPTQLFPNSLHPLINISQLREKAPALPEASHTGTQNPR